MLRGVPRGEEAPVGEWSCMGAGVGAHSCPDICVCWDAGAKTGSLHILAENVCSNT